MLAKYSILYQRSYYITNKLLSKSVNASDKNINFIDNYLKFFK